MGYHVLCLSYYSNNIFEEHPPNFTVWESLNVKPMSALAKKRTPRGQQLQW